MIQSRGGPCFPAETFQRLRVRGQFIWQEFQSDKATEVEVLGLVNYPHPAATQLINDAVMRDGLAQHSKGTPALDRNVRPDNLKFQFLQLVGCLDPVMRQQR